MTFFLLYIAIVSLAVFCLYGYDKYRAINKKRRIPEAVLHGLTLVGGTPGAIAGQLVFRHKTKKWKFRLVFFMILILQMIGLLWWLGQVRS